MELIVLPFCARWFDNEKVETNVLHHFGPQLRITRTKLRLPGQFLCKRAGVSRGRLSEIETGLSEARPEEMARLRQALDELKAAHAELHRLALDLGWPEGRL